MRTTTRDLRSLPTPSSLLPLVLTGLLALPVLLLAACGLGEPGPNPVPPSTVPADATDRAHQFVLEFLQAREDGDEARAGLYLSPTARQQFAAGEGGLRLTGGYTATALLSLDQADASSWQARVRLETAEGAVEEYLFVGAGPGPDGEQRELTVRGAERIAAGGTGAGGGAAAAGPAANPAPGRGGAP